MPTIPVRDGNNALVNIETPNANGRAAAAGSRPVALSTEDLAAIQLLATAAAQEAGNTALANILTTLASRATAANQQTGNTTLASILAALTNPLEIIGGVTISDWSQLVDLMRAAPQPVVDGGSEYVWVPRGVLSNGSVQTIAAPNANRRAFYLSNPATVNQYYRIIGGDASIGGVGSDLLVPGAWRLWAGKACPKGAVTVICGEAGRAITAYEA